MVGYAAGGFVAVDGGEGGGWGRGLLLEQGGGGVGVGGRGWWIGLARWWIGLSVWWIGLAVWWISLAIGFFLAHCGEAARGLIGDTT